MGDSTLECYRWGWVNKLDDGTLEYGNHTSNSERTFLTKLMHLMEQKDASIPRWSCFVGNHDMSLKSHRSNPVTANLIFNVFMGTTSSEAFFYHWFTWACVT